MIKKAKEKDISVIEEILLDAVNWLSKNGMQNTWNESNIKWAELSKSFNINDFYISYENELPAACMALTDFDPVFWPDIPKGESLYLHKVAVKRACAGKGFTKELINFAKSSAQSQRINTIRLNCNQHRNKLRKVYEKEGFICVEEKIFFENHETALYLCNVKK